MSPCWAGFYSFWSTCNRTFLGYLHSLLVFGFVVFSPALFKVGAWPSYQLRGGIVCKECVPCHATILEGLAERSGSSTHSLVTFFWKKDHLQRHEGKWDKMQHDLSSKINLKSLTDLVDKGNPTVLLLQDFSESPAFVLWISNSVSCAGEDGD